MSTTTKLDKEAILTRAEERAWAGLEDAFETVRRASVLDEPVEVFDRNGNSKGWVYPSIEKSTVDAAIFLINHLLGRPGQKEAGGTDEDRFAGLLKDIRRLHDERKQSISREIPSDEG